MNTNLRDGLAVPKIVDRSIYQAELDALRIREKAHTREGDAIAAARRRLPMVEIDGSIPVVGAVGVMPLIDTFEGRKLMFASYHMWHTGRPAAEQCEGCTFNTGHVLELSYLHSRDVTYAVFCEGSFDESNRYREFMGWEMPWYSVPESSAARLFAEGQHFGLKVCLLDHRSRMRDYGEQLRDARYDGLRPPGAVGELARWLAAAGARRRFPQQRTANFTMVPAGRGPLRQPRQRRALKHADYFSSGRRLRSNQRSDEAPTHNNRLLRTVRGNQRVLCS